MQIKNLSMSYGINDLFKDVNLYIPDYEKVGIVGANGAGKSTFLKIIMGIISPNSGKIVINTGARIGYLPQVISDEVPLSKITVFDYLLEGRPINELNKRLDNIYKKLADAKDITLNKLYKEIDSINKKLEYFEEYSADSTLLKIIDGMMIDEKLLDQKLNTLSGGQKSKVAFARLLYSKPEFILLDEPTNHLDNKTKEYVINFIKNYKGGIFVISHDIDFLNKVTTKTLFLDNRLKNFSLFSGNYDDFVRQYKAKEKTLENARLKQAKEEEKLKKIVDKYFSSSGNRKKMAQDREKKLEKLLQEKIEIIKPSKQVKILLPMKREGSNIPLTINNICFKYNKNDKINIINNLSFSLLKGEKVLILGENGVGKSTLLKLIMGKIKVDKGEIKFGVKTDLGYYAQEHELLDQDKNILDNFLEFDISMKSLRSVLGRFLFFDDDVYKKISVLSPGERSRVSLAKLSLSGANLLILDEPTNHLDSKTQEIIANTFKEFKGTMLVVSHNISFVDNLGIDKVLILPSGKMVRYDKSLVKYYYDLNNLK